MCSCFMFREPDGRGSIRINGQLCQWATRRPSSSTGAPLLVFCGLDGAGKTTCIQTLLAGPSHPAPHKPQLATRAASMSFIPTPKTEQKNTDDAHFTQPFIALDLPGGQGLRQGWAAALSAADGLVLVVSCVDRLRFPAVRDSLWRMMRLLAQRSMPCLVLATKLDLASGPASAPALAGQLVMDLDLAHLMAGLPAPWMLKPACSTSYNDVAEGIGWLLQRLGDMQQVRGLAEPVRKEVLAAYAAANTAYSDEILQKKAASLIGFSSSAVMGSATSTARPSLVGEEEEEEISPRRVFGAAPQAPSPDDLGRGPPEISRSEADEG